jgi:hypothetical protein
LWIFSRQIAKSTHVGLVGDRISQAAEVMIVMVTLNLYHYNGTSFSPMALLHGSGHGLLFEVSL